MTTLELCQSSLKWNLKPHDFYDDLARTLKSGPHVVGFTEVRKFTDELQEFSKDHFYYFIKKGPGDGALLVRDDIRLLDFGAELANEGIKGAYGPRYIDWVQLKWEGEEIFVHESHWNTGFYETKQRRIRHAKQTDIALDLTAKHAKGYALSFLMGDINVDMSKKTQTSTRFQDSHITTSYNELKVYPNTHDNRSIDFIASADADKRVRADEIRIIRRQEKDHNDLFTNYHIKARR